MGRVRTKICGITTPEDALLAVEAGADAVGVIFAESPRQVSPAVAERIVRVLPPWVTSVGVFVNTAPEEIARVADQVGLDAVQFHGDELPCQVEDVARHHRVLKAFRIADAADLGDALDYLGQCRPHACLIDARVEGRYGGTGHTAPWELIGPQRSALWPLVLGGGLTPENVGRAIEVVRPFGVETSSGVEHEPGRKDPDRVRAFVRIAAGMTVEFPRDGRVA